jgi:Holliday junction resolvase-like predicted endonuclease
LPKIIARETRGRGRVLSLANAGLHHGGAQLPLAARRGEIGLIGWEDDVLCFVEVKTRTTRDGKTGVAAVDRHKRREATAVEKQYLRRLPPSCQWRFDVVSVYYGTSKASPPLIEVFRNASLTA